VGLTDCSTPFTDFFSNIEPGLSIFARIFNPEKGLNIKDKNKLQ